MGYATSSKWEKWDEMQTMAMWLDIVKMMGYNVVFSMSPWWVMIYVDRIGGVVCLSTTYKGWVNRLLYRG